MLPGPIGTAFYEQGAGLGEWEASAEGTGVPLTPKKVPAPMPDPLAHTLPWIGAVTLGPGSGLRLGRGGRENGRPDIRLTLQLLAFILLGLVFL